MKKEIYLLLLKTEIKEETTKKKILRRVGSCSNFTKMLAESPRCVAMEISWAKKLPLALP